MVRNESDRVLKIKLLPTLSERTARFRMSRVVTVTRLSKVSIHRYLICSLGFWTLHRWQSDIGCKLTYQELTAWKRRDSWKSWWIGWTSPGQSRVEVLTGCMRMCFLPPFWFDWDSETITTGEVRTSRSSGTDLIMSSPTQYTIMKRGESNIGTICEEWRARGFGVGSWFRSAVSLCVPNELIFLTGLKPK